MPAQALRAPEEFTIHHVREMSLALIEAARSGEALNLDLSAVSHIDTAGLQLLLTLRREAARSLTRLEFANPSWVVSEMVGFYRLGSLLDTPAQRINA